MLPEIKNKDNFSKEDITPKIFLIILASSVLPAIAVGMIVMYIISFFG